MLIYFFNDKMVTPSPSILLELEIRAPLHHVSQQMILRKKNQ